MQRGPPSLLMTCATVPKVQSVIRSRPISTVTRPSPHSALPKMQHRFRHSELELRGPRKGLKIGPRSS
eukprot:10449856-Alexandrium_andersonii.AAC.1